MRRLSPEWLRALDTRAQLILFLLAGAACGSSRRRAT